MSKFNLQLAFLLLTSILFAQDKSYYKRGISNVNDQWHRIDITQDMFKNINTDFSDIRIYGIKGDDTIEVPYFIPSKKLPSAYKTRNIKLASLNKSTSSKGYFVTFNNEAKKLINRIELDIDETNFDYIILLEGSEDQKEWFTIKEENRVFGVKNNQVNFSYTDVTFKPVNYAYLRMCFIKADDVKLNAAKVIDKKKDSVVYLKYNSNYNVKQNKELKRTEITIDLPYKVPVNNIEVLFNDKHDYYRKISIEALRDSIVTKGKGVIYNYEEMYREYISSINENDFEDFLPSYGGNNLFSNKWRVLIDNHDNPSLDIKDVIVKSYPNYLIARFDEQDRSYFMTYGQKGKRAPNYDITNFKSKVPKTLKKIVLSSEEKVNFTIKEDKESSLFFRTEVLWVLMLAIMAFLGLFTYKMLKEKQ